MEREVVYPIPLTKDKLAHLHVPGNGQLTPEEVERIVKYVRGLALLAVIKRRNDEHTNRR